MKSLVIFLSIFVSESNHPLTNKYQTDKKPLLSFNTLAESGTQKNRITTSIALVSGEGTEKQILYDLLCNKKSKQPIKPMIYAYALDNILVAMKGKRIFERFGFNLSQQPSKKHTRKLVENFETWVFPYDATDWINPETGESLTGYLQPIELSYLLNACINTENH